MNHRWPALDAVLKFTQLHNIVDQAGHTCILLFIVVCKKKKKKDIFPRWWDGVYACMFVCVHMHMHACETQRGIWQVELFFSSLTYIWFC